MGQSQRNYRKDHSLIPLDSCTPAVAQRVRTIAEMVSQGKSRLSVMSFIENDMGYSHSQAKEYYETAIAYLCPDDEEEYRRGLIQVNFNRLEDIIERSMSGPEKNLKLAKECIAEMNRVLVASQKLVIENVKDNNGNEAFRITFGNE